MTACSLGIWSQGQYFSGERAHPADRPLKYIASAHGSAQVPLDQSSWKICFGGSGTKPDPKLPRRIKTAASPRFMVWSGQNFSGLMLQPAVRPFAYRISMSL